MTQIITFKPSKKKADPPPRQGVVSSKDVSPFIEDDDEDGGPALTVQKHINATFLNLDELRTAIVGDFAAIRPLIAQLGDVEERQRIMDVQHRQRGPGVIITVEQAKRLLDMMDEVGWEDISSDLRLMTEARYNTLMSQQHLHKRAVE